jgi:hypothetical protein
MKTSSRLKLEAVDSLLGNLLPMLNDISSSAWFVKEGRLQYSKHRQVEEQLEKWLSENGAILPSRVTSPVSRLNSRIVDWGYSNGRGATPQNFATDEKDSFHEVTKALEAYKKELIEQSDKEDLDAAVANKLRGPWASGSFYLVVVLILLTALAVIA